MPVSAIRKLWDTLRRFAAARRGNIAVIFALASLPLVAAVGTAVDYSNANAARTAMQMALDSTALMLSKDAASITDTALDTKATAYFNALYTRKDVGGIQVGATYSSTNGSQVVVTGSGTVQPAFMKVMGFTSITIHGTSTVVWGQNRLRVALALDTTLSMADDGKMDALKPAAKNLLTQLKTAATKNGDIYVSIIPFSRDVNVGTAAYTQNWVKWSGASDTWNENNGTCRYYSGWSQPQTKSACQNNAGSWTADNHSTWNGCIMDRDQDYDTTNTAPTTSINGTLFPAEQYNSCPAQMMGLSYDWSALSGKIDGLYPAGSTNQTIGLQWAFQSLTASPFTIPPKEANYKYSDVIILMTDGLNTQNRFASTQSQVDAREKKLCANIKAANITIYTIFVNTGGDPEQQVLKDCASDSTKFFAITRANQIVSVFTQIGSTLAQLRISK